jgi:small subunit ribosomal protein S1
LGRTSPVSPLVFIGTGFFWEMKVTDQDLTKDKKDDKWYEQLLDDYDYQSPQVGQLLTGEIIRIDDDVLLVDVGLKRDAIVPAGDLSKLKPEVRGKLAVGDQVQVYVTRPAAGNQDLLVSLSQGIEHENWEQAKTHLEQGAILLLEVIGLNQGGLLVRYDELRGFVPNSKIPELRNIRDRRRVELAKRDMIGSHIAVKTIEVDQEKDRLVFSAEAAEEEQRKQRLRELEKGQVLRGKVVTIVDFGVFLDLNGVDGLVHISELDWQRVNHASDVCKLGDEFEVQVVEVDLDRERVSLSRKAILPNPWEALTERLKPGETVAGRVTNVLDFGAFVELPGGIQGLLHASEIDGLDSRKPQEVLEQGEQLLVRIVNLDPHRERVSLSLRQVASQTEA